MLCIFTGTGKTVVGVHIVYWLFKNIQKRPVSNSQKKRAVLYCGPSNKSVDVVAGKFAGNFLAKVVDYSDIQYMRNFTFSMYSKDCRISKNIVVPIMLFYRASDYLQYDIYVPLVKQQLHNSDLNSITLSTLLHFNKCVAGHLLKLRNQLKPLRVYSAQMEMLEFPYPGCNLKLSRNSKRGEKPNTELRYLPNNVHLSLI